MLERAALEVLKPGFHVGHGQQGIAGVEVFEDTTHGGMGRAVSAGARLVGLDPTDQQQRHAVRRRAP